MLLTASVNKRKIITKFFWNKRRNTRKGTDQHGDKSRQILSQRNQVILVIRTSREPRAIGGCQCAPPKPALNLGLQGEAGAYQREFGRRSLGAFAGPLRRHQGGPRAARLAYSGFACKVDSAIQPAFTAVHHEKSPPLIALHHFITGLCLRMFGFFTPIIHFQPASQPFNIS